MRQSSFGQTANGSSFIDWKTSKLFLHLLHSYSYVGMWQLRKRGFYNRLAPTRQPASTLSFPVPMTNARLLPASLPLVASLLVAVHSACAGAELALIDEINQLRANPPAYAKCVAESPFRGRAAREAIAVLQHTAPMQ